MGKSGKAGSAPRATLATVAASCGVSVMTVSLILNGKDGLFKPETSKRVFEAAELLGYRPNSFARSMRSGRMNSVAMLAADDSATGKWFPASLLYGAMAELYAKDIQLSVTHIPVSKIKAGRPFPKIFRECCADGLLINYIEKLPDAMREFIESAKVPAVNLNCVREGMDCVHPDDKGAFLQATRKMIELGHRRILFACFQFHRHYSYQARLDGYREAMAEAGLQAQELLPRMTPPPGRPAQAMELFSKRSKAPTAVVAANGGNDAMPFMVAAAALGISVPSELSLITCDDVWHIPFDCVSCLELPFEKVGREAAKLLLRRIDYPKGEPVRIAVPFGARGDSSPQAPAP